MREKLAHLHVVVLIYMVQAGLVLFRFPQLEADYFGTNGWVSLLICFVAAAFNILLLLPVLKMARGRSIFDIMERSVPRMVLLPFYLAIAAIWGMNASTAAKEYVHILKMVIFPTVSPWVFALTIGLLAYYLYGKGIYNIAKAAIIFFVLSVWMTFLLFYFFEEFRWSRMTPFLFQDSKQLLAGFMNVYPSYLGYELVLLMIPYADAKTKLARAAFKATFFASMLYLFVGVVCFGIFSLQQLRMSTFPVLDLLAIIRFPFMERIENLFYGFFLFSNIVTSTVYYWAASQFGGRIAPRWQGKPVGAAIIAACVGLSLVPNTLMETEKWVRYAGYAGMGVAIGLPVVLIGFLLLQGKGGAVREQP